MPARSTTDGSRASSSPRWPSGVHHAVAADLTLLSELHCDRLDDVNDLAIVLAAGKGTRMKSDLPKVLCPVRGRPMIDFVLDALRASGVDHMVVVVGYRSDLVREALRRPGTIWSSSSRPSSWGPGTP